MQIIYDAYSHKLKAVAESGNEERAEIAEEFLQVLEPNYHRPIHIHIIEDYSLTKDEREEIKSAFREYNGRFNAQQKDALRKYKLYTSPGKGGHAKITYEGTNYNIFISSHRPSDYRTGIHAAHNIIDLIEKGRKHEAERNIKSN